MSRSYISSPLRLYRRVVGLLCFIFYLSIWSRGRSVSIVSDYRLDDQGSILGEAKDFSFSLCVQASSEVHPASYLIGIWCTFPGVKRDQGVTLTTHPSSAEIKNE
jgi:hypothetical protein